MKQKSGGFTLIELLVVIAIIGILSAVAIVNLSSARDKAKQSNVLSVLSQLTSAVITCFDDEKNLTIDGSTLCVGTAPSAGASICEGSSAKWPDLIPQGWYYYSCTSNYLAIPTPTWQIAACSKSPCASPARFVSCQATGCIPLSF